MSRKVENTLNEMQDNSMPMIATIASHRFGS